MACSHISKRIVGSAQNYPQHVPQVPLVPPIMLNSPNPMNPLAGLLASVAQSQAQGQAIDPMLLQTILALTTAQAQGQDVGALLATLGQQQPPPMRASPMMHHSENQPLINEPLINNNLQSMMQNRPLSQVQQPYMNPQRMNLLQSTQGGNNQRLEQQNQQRVRDLSHGPSYQQFQGQQMQQGQMGLMQNQGYNMIQQGSQPGIPQGNQGNVQNSVAHLLSQFTSNQNILETMRQQRK
jgi:hypothetical protein